MLHACGELMMQLHEGLTRDTGGGSSDLLDLTLQVCWNAMCVYCSCFGFAGFAW